MKLYTPEATELIDVTSIHSHPAGLLIEGRIMGAMPMKAVLRPRELRSAIGLLGPRTILTLIAMLFRRDR